MPLVDIVGILLLDMGRVQQHLPAQIDRRRRRVDGAFKARFHERRQVAAVIDMRVREDDAVERLRVNRHLPVALLGLIAPSLKQPAVEDELTPVRVDLM